VHNFWTAVVFAVIPAALLLLAIYYVDRHEKEPIRLLAIALLFGAVIAPLVAVLLEKAFGAPTSMATQATVPLSRLNTTTPIVEEAVRAAAILAVILLVLYEVDDILDGLIYGAVVGVGFALAANFVSIISTPNFGESNSASLFATSVSGLNHLFYGGVIGVLVAAVRRRGRAWMAGAAVVGWLVAAGFHLIHDYLPSWVGSSAGDVGGGGVRSLLTDLPNVLGLVALAVIAVFALGREAYIVGHELRPEVERGVATPEDYANLTNSARRFWTLFHTLFSRGEHAWRLRRQIFSLETELAFRKYHRREDRQQSRHYRDEDSYRKQIVETRAQLEALLAEGVTAR